jgi:YesN/AraC family two-component response regulator
VKALGAGVDAYIMKPFAKAAVVEQLQRVGLVA